MRYSSIRHVASASELGMMSVLLTLIIITWASFAVNLTFGESSIILAQVTRSSNDPLTVGNTDFSLNCIVAEDLNDPSFTFQWRKDGEVIPDTIQQSLLLSPLRASTTGVYNCSASVSSSSLSSSPTMVDSCNIEVLYLQLPIPNSMHISYHNTTAGSVAMLSCTVNMDPSVDISVTVRTVWTGPAEFMTTNTAQQISLYIYTSTTMVVGSHAGVYTCTVTILSDSSSLLRNSVERTAVKAIAGVYLLLNKVMYANNSFILITEIGQSSEHNALQCVTDKIPCCERMETRAGEWFFPDHGVVPIQNYGATFFRNRGNDGTVNLNRLHSAVSTPMGLFCCVVPDARNIRVTLCANIVNFTTRQVTRTTYIKSNVAELPSTVTINVQVTIDFNLTSSRESKLITFSLMCTSSGGPVNSVTWIRDGVLLENTGLLLRNNTSTATYVYTNILKVGSRTAGTYTCQMRGNNNQVLGASDFTVYAAPMPSNVQGTRSSASAPVEISWSPPWSDDEASISASIITGYRIFYGEGESILVPSYVTRILLNFVLSQDVHGQIVSIRSESIVLPSELTEVHVDFMDEGRSVMSSLSCSAQLGITVGMILLLVGLLAVTVVVIFYCWSKKYTSTKKEGNDFSKARNVAYGDVSMRSVEGNVPEAELYYDDPSNIVDDKHKY